MWLMRKEGEFDEEPSGSNSGGGFGKPEGGHETRGGGDGLKRPDGQLSIVEVQRELVPETHLVMMMSKAIYEKYGEGVKKMVFEDDDYKDNGLRTCLEDVIVKTGQKHGKWHGSIAFVYDFLHSINNHRRINIINVDFVGASLKLSLSSFRNGDVVFDEFMLRTFLLISFDFKTMIEFDYKSRTDRLIKGQKRFEAYGLKGWKHIVCFNKGWSDESSFMKEAFF
nr:hypothetical protein [Tanacetum cinerariifolium]